VLEGRVKGALCRNYKSVKEKALYTYHAINN
jgi:hypothetical protein